MFSLGIIHCVDKEHVLWDICWSPQSRNSSLYEKSQPPKQHTRFSARQWTMPKENIPFLLGVFIFVFFAQCA
jgi:hypothetical protein